MLGGALPSPPQASRTLQRTLLPTTSIITRRTSALLDGSRWAVFPKFRTPPCPCGYRISRPVGMPLSAGTRLGSAYEVLARLGAGGMGEVYQLPPILSTTH